MTLSRKLSLLLALVALPALATPAWSQDPGAIPETQKPKTKAKRADPVREAKPGAAPKQQAGKQGDKQAERIKNAREKQQEGAKNAKRTQEARDKQTAERTQEARDKQTAERTQEARDKQTAERTQEARDKQTAERTQEARDKQTAERTDQARDKQQAAKGAERAAEARAKMKALDTKALRSLGNQIKIHEANVARIDKLTEIFTRKKDNARLEQVRKLRSAEDQRYEAIIGRFKNALGEERFASVRARLETSKRKRK